MLTYNQRHNEYMLLHSAKGTSSIDCLSKTLTYLNHTDHSQELRSFSVKWKKSREVDSHISYFMAQDKDEAEAKFLHEKDPIEYQFEVFENPVA